MAGKDRLLFFGVAQLFRVVFLQLVATGVAVAVAGGWAGLHGAVSAGLGGIVCVLPNFLFALRLSRVAQRPKASYPVNFFLGEFIKMALTVGLLVLIVKNYADLHWFSLLGGLVLAVQAGFLAFWKKS